MITDFFTQLAFAFGVTAPIFVLVALGIVLKTRNFLDSTFTNSASKLVFNICMPTMLFFAMVNTDIRATVDFPYLGVALSGTLLLFILFSLVAPIVVTDKRDRGVFVQGAFRSNLAIIGLAFCLNAYGEEGLAKGSVLMSVVTIFYNILSIYTLNQSLSESKTNFFNLLLGVLKNPLILGIAAGIGANLIQLPVPSFAATAGEYVARMTLPLALIYIGASLSLSEFRSSSIVSVVAVFAKLIVMPTALLIGAYWIGFPQTEMGILFLMMSAPSAAAGYVMVQALGGNAKLAANIIVLSTLASIVTVSVGLAVLKQTGIA